MVILVHSELSFSRSPTDGWEMSTRTGTDPKYKEAAAPRRGTPPPQVGARRDTGQIQFGPEADGSGRLGVLVVDDSYADRHAIQQMLPAGWVMWEASSGAEGLAVVAEKRPHCALVAETLDDMPGLRFLQELQELTHAEVMASVLMAREEDADLAIMGMKRGAVDFMVKSGISGDTVHRTLHFALERVALKQQIMRQQAELERLATTDPLTDLYNRRYLSQRLEAEVRRARRYKAQLCLMMMDIDMFKGVNDGYGHAAGDDVIRAFADAIRINLRDTDMAARYGGDEFCVVLPETGIQGAEGVAERIRRSVENAEVPAGDGRVIRVTASIGVAELGWNHTDADHLNQSADSMLYEAKERGRNNVAALPAVPSASTIRRARREKADPG